MTCRRLSPLLKLLPAAGALAVLFLATGCWDEEGEFPSPTPTPSPTASPFPTATPTPTPTQSSSSVAQSTAGEVALDNAEIIEAAANDSVSELKAVEEALISEDLTSAQSSLTGAREAFFLVEASLYYSDPENAGELGALPPKLASVLPSLAIPGFDDLDAFFTGRLAGESAPSDADLLALAKSLRADLEVLSEAWAANVLGNFRNTVFLPDPDAPARIFQGVAATADLLVLSSLAPEKQSQILPRLWTLKDLLEGDYESFSGETTSGAGLLTLLAETDPSAAQNIADLLDALIIQQRDSVFSGQPLLPASLESLREELLAAARSLGYELDSVPSGSTAGD